MLIKEYDKDCYTLTPPGVKFSALVIRQADRPKVDSARTTQRYYQLILTDLRIDQEIAAVDGTSACIKAKAIIKDRLSLIINSIK